MKLIFCSHCSDVFKLHLGKTKKCGCGRSWGQYGDYLNATYGGLAVPLGFANPSLVEAMKGQPIDGDGKTFTAFVIPKNCPTFKKV